MASKKVEKYRDDAEVYHGEELCKQKAMELLEEISMPKGLLPLDELVEVGHNRSCGFVWLKREKKKVHRFRRMNTTSSYDELVTAFVEDRRMKKVTGVKSKELFLWVTLSDICVDDPSSGKILFSNPTGLSRSYPVSALVLEQEEEKESTVKENELGKN